METGWGWPAISFGTGVILSNLARYTTAKAFVLFSSPARYLDYPGVGEDERPKLFVCGDRDNAVPVHSLKEKLECLARTSAWPGCTRSRPLLGGT